MDVFLLYQEYAVVLREMLGIEVKTCFPSEGSPEAEMVPGMQVGGRNIEPADGVIISPEDILAIVCEETSLDELFLNRHSLLRIAKQGKGSYCGARWDRARDIKKWCTSLVLQPQFSMASAIFLPGGGVLSRSIERWIPGEILLGGFLAVMLQKQSLST